MGDEGWRAWMGWRGVLTSGGLVALLGVGYLGWRLAAVPSAAEEVAAEARAAQATTSAAGDGGATSAAARMLLVFVSGAVSHPGMYRLAAGLRVSDALAAAGGVLPDADPDKLPNLAAKLTDGKQVKVPRRAKATSGGSATTDKVDINSATLAELEAVPGVDPDLADAIVAYRESFGPFGSVSDLKAALGLDTETVSQLRRYLTAL